MYNRAAAMEKEDSATVCSDDSDAFDTIWLRPESSESSIEWSRNSAKRSRIDRMCICDDQKLNIVQTCNHINESDGIAQDGQRGSCVDSCTSCCPNNVALSSSEPDPVPVSYRRQDCIYQVYWYMQDFRVHIQESYRYCLLLYEESQLMDNCRSNLEEFLSSLINNFPIQEDATTHCDIFTFKMLEPIESALEFLREFKSISDSDLIEPVTPANQVYHQLASYCRSSVNCLDDILLDEEQVEPLHINLDTALEYLVGTTTITPTVDAARCEKLDTEKDAINDQTMNLEFASQNFQKSPPSSVAKVLKKKSPRKSLPRRPVIEKIRDVTMYFCKVSGACFRMLYLCELAKHIIALHDHFSANILYTRQSRCDIIWHNVFDRGIDGIIFESPRKVRLCIKVRGKVDGRQMLPKLAWKDPISGSTINCVNMFQISHIFRGTEKKYKNISTIANSTSFTVQIGKGASYIFQVMDVGDRDELVAGLTQWMGELVCKTIIGGSS